MVQVINERVVDYDALEADIQAYLYKHGINVTYTALLCHCWHCLVLQGCSSSFATFWLTAALERMCKEGLVECSEEREEHFGSWRPVWYKLSTSTWLMMTRSQQLSLTVSTHGPKALT